MRRAAAARRAISRLDTGLRAEPAPAGPPLDNASLEPMPGPHADLLRRWMSLAEMQRRVIHTLAAEVAHTSSMVETEADALSQRFQALAVGAEQQTGLVDHLTGLAIGVEMAGKTVSVDEIARLLETTLDDVVAKIVLLSKESMSMVEALDVLNGNVRHVEKSLGEIDRITHVTHMVALNARIEAERSGAAGAAFRVVADEVKQLSGSIQTLAVDMNKQLKAVRDGIRNGHATLKQVASVDMSSNMQIKERLGALLPALVSRNTEIKSLVADAAREASAMSADVSGMITGIQFQDRTKQRLEHVIDTLHVVGEAVEDVMNTTRHTAPELAGELTPDPEWVRNLLSRYTMSELRERFVAQILDGKPVEWPADTAGGSAAAVGGSVDLF